jgi:hypothetical protein
MDNGSDNGGLQRSPTHSQNLGVTTGLVPSSVKRGAPNIATAERGHSEAAINIGDAPGGLQPAINAARQAVRTLAIKIGFAPSSTKGGTPSSEDAAHIMHRASLGDLKPSGPRDAIAPQKPRIR